MSDGSEIPHTAADSLEPSPGSSPSLSPPPLAPPPRRRTLGESLFLRPDGAIRSGWRVALYLAFFALILLALQLLAPLLHLGSLSRTITITPLTLGIQEFLAVVSAFAAALGMSKIEGCAFREYGLPPHDAFRGAFWIGAVWGIAGVSALVLLIRAFGGYSFGTIALGGGEIARYALEWGAVFLLVGFYEEFFFRGYVQFTLAQGIRFWPAALLTSAVFGAVHLQNPGEGPVGAVSVFVTGMFLCLTLRRTGNLWFAVGWHAAFDFGETFLYSVPDSGIVAPGHLLAASFHGPRWLTGGSIGPEGSVFDFVVLPASALLFALVYRARPASPGASEREPIAAP